MRKQLLALCVGAALLLGACSGTSTSTTAGSAAVPTGVGGADTLTLGEIAFPTSFDVNGYSISHQVSYFTAVFDTLVREDGDGNLKPGLATAWSYDSGKTNLTLTLRTGVKFTDGTDFNADAVVSNYKNFKASTTADLFNAQYISGVTAPDATHVVYALSAPDPMLTTWLAGSLGYQASPKSFTNADVKTNPVGSGPYTLDTSGTVAGSKYVFKKNPNYWDTSYHVYKTLTINYYAQGTALMNALLGKQLDASTYSDFTTLAQVVSAGYTKDKNQLDVAGLILFDRDGKMDSPLGNVKVRQAINYALDKDGMVKSLFNGEGTATSSWMGAATSGFDPSLDTYYTYDVAKAKSLLADAGYASGFTLTMPTSSVLSQAVYTTIQQELAAIGITVKYEDAGTNYVTNQIAGKYSSCFMFLASANTWQFSQLALVPKATFNPFHSQSSETDALFTKIQTGSDADAAQAAKDLNKYITQNAWFAPILRNNNYWVSNSSVKVQMAKDNTSPYLYLIQPA
jgi:peptide/nickel transport system substrate-binding protein